MFSGAETPQLEELGHEYVCPAQFLLCSAAKLCIFIALSVEITRFNDVTAGNAGGTEATTKITKEVVMLTSIRGLTAATIATGLAFAATPALADETVSQDTLTELGLETEAVPASDVVTVADTASAEIAVEEVEAKTANFAAGESGFEFSGNAALVSEYRFRGVDLSGGDIAVQGGVDLAHSSGFYVGTWGSSLDEDTVGYGHTELDVYGGFSGDLAEGLSFDLGVIAYLYPNAGPGDFDYVELTGSVGFTFGPAEVTLGGAYAPEQDSLGGTDNIYVYTELGVGIPTTPLTVTGRVGYTDGFLTFTNDSKAFDWSIGVETTIAGPVSAKVEYTGAEGDIPAGNYDFVDDAVVFTLSASI
ncbi:MAG: TorF family putative porin [Erythrobacter sp.]